VHDAVESGEIEAENARKAILAWWRAVKEPETRSTAAGHKCLIRTLKHRNLITGRMVS
jgi:hypothetical protein